MGRTDRVTSRAGRVGIVVGAVAAATVLAAPIASAEPSSQPSQTPEASIPMPVREGALGYLATRSSTLWLADRGVDQVIANLPAPPAYSSANRQMAKTLKQELDAAVDTPGACLQIIVDGPGQTGGVFNYGFFAVEKQYCPK